MRRLLGGILIASCVTGFAHAADAPDGRESISFGMSTADERHPLGPVRFSVADRHYVLRGDGRGEVRSGTTEPQPFSLGVPEGFLLEGLYYGAYGRGVVLYYQFNRGGDLGARVSRIARDASAPVWTVDVPGFNIGEPLGLGPKLYLAALGFVGKLDLETGAYDWSHADLYTNEAFQAFQKPRLADGVVVFVDESQLRQRRGARVRVDDASGEILAIEAAVPEPFARALMRWLFGF